MISQALLGACSLAALGLILLGVIAAIISTRKAERRYDHYRRNLRWPD